MGITLNTLMRCCIFTVFILISCPGCGYRRPSQVITTGTITLDGKPVKGASVLLIPEKGRPGSAMSSNDGEFKVSSYGGNDGLQAGLYRVCVSKMILKPRFQKQIDTLRERALAAAEPGEAPEEVDIEFGENAYNNALPEKYEKLDTTDITVTITKQQKPLVISLTSESE